MNSSDLKQTVFAMMYGDGFVDYNEISGKARLDIYHSEPQLPLLEYKQEVLLGITNLGCSIKEKIDSRPLKSGSARKGHRLLTTFSPYLGKLSRVPKIVALKQMIKPRALAMLWMDDGTLVISKDGNYSTATLCTDAWKWEEVEVFRKLWNKQYGWCPELMHYKCRGVIYPRLRLRKKEMQKLTDIIKSYVLPCMEYKLLDS